MYIPDKIKNLFIPDSKRKMSIYLVFHATDEFLKSAAQSNKNFSTCCMEAISSPLGLGRVDNSNGIELIYYASTKAEALLAIERRLFLEHFEHFSAWATHRTKLPVFASPAWEEYKKVSLIHQVEASPNSCFALRMELSAVDLVSFLRIVGRTQPMALSSEPPEEMLSYMVYTDSPTPPPLLAPLVTVDPDVTFAVSKGVELFNKIVRPTGQQQEQEKQVESTQQE